MFARKRGLSAQAFGMSLGFLLSDHTIWVDVTVLLFGKLSGRGGPPAFLLTAKRAARRLPQINQLMLIRRREDQPGSLPRRPDP